MESSLTIPLPSRPLDNKPWTGTLWGPYRLRSERHIVHALGAGLASKDSKGRMALLVVLLVLLGAILGYGLSVYTAPTYTPLLGQSTYFYDPATSPHLANVVMPPERSILFQFANGPTRVASILVYNGTIYYRYDWQCAPSDPCWSAPAPNRYFVFVGTSTTPNVQWNKSDTTEGPFYPMTGALGCCWQSPLTYDWQPGKLYSFFVEDANDTVTLSQTWNAPVTSSNQYCADYSCSPLNPTYRIVSFVLVGAFVLPVLGLLARRQVRKWSAARSRQPSIEDS